MRKSGTLVFESGLRIWVNGLSKREEAAYVRRYGKIVRFIPS